MQLAAGHGFSVDFIWNFVETGGSLPAVGTLPIPSNAHWMPLASLVQVPFIWVLGPTPLASALPFWLASAAVAARSPTGSAGTPVLPRWQATAAGLMVAMPALVDPFLAQPDNFGLFMLLGTLSPVGLRTWPARRSPRVRAWVACWWVSPSCHATTGCCWASRSRSPSWRTCCDARARRASAGRAALLCAGGFLLVASPWILPSAGGVRLHLALRSVGPHPVDHQVPRPVQREHAGDALDSFLAQGLGPLLTSRVLGLVNALGLFATQLLLIFLVPFLVLGIWWQPPRPGLAALDGLRRDAVRCPAACCSRSTCPTARSCTRRSRSSPMPTC